MTESQYVQYGCGWKSAPAEWRNFDASPTLWFERIPLFGRLYTKNSTRFPENAEFGDIVKGLPVPPNSCKAVYCSHTLEHLALADFRIALQNTRQMLVPSGVFRFVLPDLEYLISQYSNDPSSEAALKFMSESRLGQEKRPRGLKGFAFAWLGNTEHLWMWDFKSMAAELERAGFVEIRRAAFGDSGDPMFEKVESAVRWQNCLGMQAIAGS